MHIVAFGASFNSRSINRKLAGWAASLVPDATYELLDLNEYDAPIFTQDREREEGSPPAARAFLDKLASADALIVSFAEHNGTYAAAFKNLFDWASRLDRRIYQDKPVLMLATSPGGRGARGVLQFAVEAAPRFGGRVVDSVSIPNWNENADPETGALTAAELRAAVERGVAALVEAAGAAAR